MTNKQISHLLRNIAAGYSIKDEKKFKFQIIAYQRAADAIENSPTEVKDLYQEGKLEALPGVGPSLRAHIEELLNTGAVKRFEWVLRDIPAAMFTLLDIPSFGPKKAYKLVVHFNLQNPNTVIEDLEKIAKQGKIATLEGFGKKSEEDILQAISEYKKGVDKTTRMVLPFAHGLAERIIEYLSKSEHVLAAYPLGSLRRMVSTIGDIDIAVSTKEPEKVISYFTEFPFKERIIEKGPTSASLLISGGKHIDLMTQPPDRFGSLLQHFTGSKNHNIHLRDVALKKGLSLSEYGIKKTGTGDTSVEKFDTEEKFYKAIGLSWIPPEMREDTGEIELAMKNKLPQIVELTDIKGDFHLHSSYPIEPSHDMGKDSMESMLEKAKSLDYQYIGFTEHNPSVSKHTSDQTYDILLRRSKIIDQLNKSNKYVRIFSLLETDILTNGNLAVDDRSLSLLDACNISIHSSFSMNKKEMTKRVLHGLSHPKAKILCHPTGRLLNQRPGYELEWETVFDFCVKHSKAIEINSWPQRLDLPDSLVREAKNYGVKFFINTDSHAASQMHLMQYGVSVARRGWLEKDDIINTFPYNKVEQWFKS